MDLAKENQFLKRILDSLPMDVFVKDAEGRYVYANHIYDEVRQQDTEADTIIGKTDFDIMPTREIAEMFAQSDAETLRTRQKTSKIVSMPALDGSVQHAHMFKDIITLENGEDGVLVYSIHPTAEQDLEEEQERQRTTDHLTNLYNRFKFLEKLEELNNPFREKTIDIVIWLDANNLKFVNDIWGHDAGDKMLCLMADAMLETFKGVGTVFRIGGDEFVIITEGSSPEEVEELLGLLDERLMNSDDFYIPMSLSSGFASLEEASSTTECVRLADERMYRKKDRNHHNNRKIIQNYASDEMLRQGLISPDELIREQALARAFCTRLRLSDVAADDVDKVLQFRKLSELNLTGKDYKAADDVLNTADDIASDDMEKSFVLMRTIFPIHVVMSVFAFSENWDGSGPGNACDKEIPYYARVARTAFETAQISRKLGIPRDAFMNLSAESGADITKEELAKLSDALQEMGTRELDLELCDQMVALLANER